MKKLVFAALLFATPVQAAENWYVGRWFGSGQPGDRSQMWVETGTADGKFHVQHRACRQGKAIDSIQDGTWALNGDILTIRLQKIDGEAFNRTDVYRILRHDDRTQTYRYEETGFVYNSRKVDGQFQMPPCDLVS
jgi:hypothetical protein